jgi:peptidoglycan-associated lipoprotein
VNRFAPIALVALAAIAGCKKKSPEEIGGVVGGVSGGTSAAVEPAKPALPPEVDEMARNFARVYFDFDSASLNAESKRALDDNATLMSRFPDVKLDVQGHADERGTTDYNMALGQKRADAVVQYLQARGVSSTRVRSVSYGEERPVDGRSAETAWAMNRRAEFVITWSGSAPVSGTAPR